MMNHILLSIKHITTTSALMLSNIKSLGDFSLNRMTWIKPNFLWMMYRSGWGTKPNQEMILAIKITRSGFEQILRLAVHSSYQASYGNRESWKQLINNSSVLLQWDPDHDPYGKKVQRRAIQLGLKSETLHDYLNKWIVEIEDISPFVQEQRAFIIQQNLTSLMVPSESVYSLPAEIKSKL